MAEATATYKASQEDYAAARQQVVLDTRTAYFNYLAARRAVKVEEQNVHQNRELLKQAQGFYQVGLRAKIDVTKAEANLYQAESELIRARNAEEVARVDLMKALGLKSWPYADVEDVLEVSPRSSTSRTCAPRPCASGRSFLRNRAQQQRDQASIQVARAGFSPPYPPPRHTAGRGAAIPWMTTGGWGWG